MEWYPSEGIGEADSIVFGLGNLLLNPSWRHTCFLHSELVRSFPQEPCAGSWLSGMWNQIHPKPSACKGAELSAWKVAWIDLAAVPTSPNGLSSWILPRWEQAPCRKCVVCWKPRFSLLCMFSFGLLWGWGSFKETCEPFLVGSSVYGHAICPVLVMHESQALLQSGRPQDFIRGAFPSISFLKCPFWTCSSNLTSGSCFSLGMVYYWWILKLKTILNMCGHIHFGDQCISRWI